MKRTITWLYIIGAVILVALIAFVVSANKAGDGNDPLSVRDNDQTKGGNKAPAVLVEYSDFQCPACATYYPIVKKMNERFGQQLNIVYRHFPLTSIHPNALAAARAAEAAGKQGKFWKMHDKIFEKQNEWANAPSPEDYFTQYANEIGLDGAAYVQDFSSDETTQKINQDRNSGNSLKVNSTPSFFLNGERIRPTSEANFIELITAAIGNAPVPEISEGDLAAAEDIHIHADFVVNINGKAFDFSDEKYQSDEPSEDEDHDHEEHALDPYTHLHNGIGNVIHVHKKGVTLGYFFKTLSMELAETCFTDDENNKYCADESSSLKFFVNGSRKQNPASYEIQDLDQILISYGSLTDSSVSKQIESVSDEACIYSETCPERGTPPEEKCVGGLGTNCEE